MVDMHDACTTFHFNEIMYTYKIYSGNIHPYSGVFLMVSTVMGVLKATAVLKLMVFPHPESFPFPVFHEDFLFVAISVYTSASGYR